MDKLRCLSGQDAVYGLHVAFIKKKRAERISSVSARPSSLFGELFREVVLLLGLGRSILF